MSLVWYILLVSFRINHARLFNQSAILTPWPFSRGDGHVGSTRIAFNERIYHISWRVTCADCCIWNSMTRFSWNSGDITLGSCAATGTACSPIDLASDVYINKYRAYWSSKMKGLWFQSSNNTNYKCGPFSSQYSYTKESGWVSYDGYYLSGFQWISGSVVNQLRFQFTSISDTYNCVAPTSATDAVLLGQGSVIYSPDGKSCFSIHEDNAEMCLYYDAMTRCLHYNDTYRIPHEGY
eukprot:921526_1